MPKMPSEQKRNKKMHVLTSNSSTTAYPVVAQKYAAVNVVGFFLIVQFNKLNNILYVLYAINRL